MMVWTRRFRGGTMAARNARHAIREVLCDELSEQRLGDVELIVSELATNSVRHAGCDDRGELSMMADVKGEYVRLRVCDHGDGFTDDHLDPDPDPAVAGGFGLMLVDRLSDRWGVHRNGGFCVWFEVERSSPA